MMSVLIVDAERSVRNSLKERFEYEGCKVAASETSDEAISVCETNNFEVVVFDDKVSGGTIDFLNKLHAVIPSVACIVISQQGTIDNAVACIKAGAVNYMSKPIDFGKLLGIVHKIQSADENYGFASIPVEIKHVRHRSGVEQIVGESKVIHHVKNLIDKVAPSDARVLITGSNGTGKELVARWLHEKSKRAGTPFVEVNCAAIPSELIESELFGHEKGAFTSAIRQRKGKFEQAHGGTLFLDEIGDMSLSAQSKVLRALQEHKICRVGSDKDIDVNVRIIAATNKDMRKEIEAANFREDLYHRLSVIVIRVPSLDERKDDIPLLTNYFIDKICKEYGIESKKIDPQAVDALKAMEWSGNIRQLHNVVERLIILSEKHITLEDVNMYVMGVW